METTLSKEPAEILVVVPTLGHRIAGLNRALDSIRSQEANFKVRICVVVPEVGANVAELFRIFSAQVLEQPRRGISAATNFAISQAHGSATHYLWLGDDDWLEPGALKHLLHLSLTHPQCPLVYGACNYRDDTGKLLWTNRSGAIASALLGWGPNLVPHPGSLIRLDALTEAGGFDEELNYAMDLDLFLRLKSFGPFRSSRQPVVNFGWQTTSATVSERNQSSAEAQMVRERYVNLLARPFQQAWFSMVRPLADLKAARLNQIAGLSE